MSGCGCWPIRASRSPPRKRARSCPRSIVVRTCIAHGRHLAGFIHACYTRQPQLAAKLMKDVIAEPYRTKLLPGFAEARQAAHGYRRAGLRHLRLRPDAVRPVRQDGRPRSAWRTGSANTICKIRKALFIFAVWIRLAHEYWDNE